MADPAPPPWEGGPYSIKRHGVTVTNCDAEPVQTPGCIQGCGALLVVRTADLTILQVSENCEAWVGAPPERLLGRPVAAAVGEAGSARLREVLAHESLDRNPIYAFTVPVGPGGPRAPLDLSAHTVDGVAVLELEPSGGATGPDGYLLVRHAAGRLEAAGTLQAFLDTAAEEVRRITQLDRVMIYRFHRDDHGEVVAEARRADLAPWLGLHYPAEDIPRPAREVFKKVWVRPLPDAQGELHELVPLARPDTGRPLDMTCCALRGASVMYTEYLRNMGVAASLTMAIRIEGELWGLIACHHYSAPAPVPWPMRVACELLAQMVSLQLRAAEDREHFLYRLRVEGVHQQIVVRAAREGGLAMLTEGSPGLLDGIDASGVALYHRERWWCVGQAPGEPQLEALAGWLESRPELGSLVRPHYATDSLSRDWPEVPSMAGVASGVLAFPLSRNRRSLMIWFRPETAQEVRWGGNPADKPTVVGPHGPRLTPRASFELFVESVRGRSRPWLPVEVDAALRLRLLLMELVVSRAEQIATLNADLSRSNEDLDAFAYVASHDLKEPLRGIHKYAHQLLAEAGALDDESRRRVEGLMRLTLRMDGLLDSLLHFSRVGRVLLDLEDVDLGEVLGEALEMVGSRWGSHEIVVPRPLPTIRGDRVRIREVFVNLVSNALKYNDRAQRRVEVGYLDPGDTAGRADVPEGARGDTVYFVKDNGIGIDRRHFDPRVEDVQAPPRPRRLRGRGRGGPRHREEAGRAARGYDLDRLDPRGGHDVLLHAPPRRPARRRGEAVMSEAPLHVVVVDDNPDDLAEVRRLMLHGSKRRYRFTEAATGAEAISACLEAPGGPPDCVILDYHLPDLDGVEVLARLHAGGPRTVCPVLVLTGDAGLHGPAVLQAGAQDYLGKSWLNAESLAHAVDNAVERYRLTREAREREARLQKSEEALRDADRRKDEFLGTLAHELRNPLAPLRMGLSLLRSAAPGPDTIRLREMMERQIGHLVSLIDDLLDVSRIGSGKVQIVRQRVALRDVVEAALETSRPLLDAARHTFTLRMPETPVFVDGDPTRLAQVLSNLLNNAAKYTPAGGHVELSAEARGGEAVLRVVDDGCGLEREMLSRVFDRFTQIDRTIARAQGGLGIGLSLVRALVEMHGGRVTADSAGEGKGSTFTVRLPLAAASSQEPMRASPAAAEAAPQHARARRVLVIDDNVDAADMLAEVLRTSGHEARVAHDGRDAIAEAQGLQPEVVFLDIGLPDMDGYEVARLLRAEPRASGAVLVALTGRGSEEDRQRSMDAGFDHHLTKPCDLEALDEILARLTG